ncbi:hypothetical protein N9N67_11630, partial [Bacteriovoracaceae bacterium]|nr:hypothetical protein [Bacteriovoracaceae bacterium]
MSNQVIFSIIFLSFTIQATYSSTGSLCQEDNRILSKRKRIGRLIRPNVDETGCTAFLIGKSCMLSAGHCRKKLGLVEFNVPLSTNQGDIRHSIAKNQYTVVRKSMRYDHGSGLDYMVFRTLPNRISKKYAGEVEGFYDLNLSKPKIGEIVEIIGYGYNHAR